MSNVGILALDYHECDFSLLNAREPDTIQELYWRTPERPGSAQSEAELEKELERKEGKVPPYMRLYFKFEGPDASLMIRWYYKAERDYFVLRNNSRCEYTPASRARPLDQGVSIEKVPSLRQLFKGLEVVPIPRCVEQSAVKSPRYKCYPLTLVRKNILTPKVPDDDPAAMSILPSINIQKSKLAPAAQHLLSTIAEHFRNAIFFDTANTDFRRIRDVLDKCGFCSDRPLGEIETFVNDPDIGRHLTEWSDFWAAVENAWPVPARRMSEF